MKQILQSPGARETLVLDVPAPSLRPGCVLVRNHASVVSAGTERAVTEFAHGSLIEKARSRPDLVRTVIDKARRDGILATVEATRARLDEYRPLGYSCAGEVIAVAPDVRDFTVGDRVACAGAGHASHAEIVCVPRNLAARLPPAVGMEAGAFCTLGAIALHGLRLGEPQLGESVAVVGLGVIGLLAAQLAIAGGCVVLGMDPDGDRCRLAESLGCSAASGDSRRILEVARSLTDGRGCDLVIIAAATPSDDPVRLAGELARHKGRVVAIGAVGTRIPRDVYYARELSFTVARSYGPGRYDPAYEEGGHDYPYGLVRWTENRNLQAFAALLAKGSVEVAPLISHRLPIARAAEAYSPPDAAEARLAVVIEYPGQGAVERRVDLATRATPRPAAGPRPTRVALGVLGAGAFARQTVLPLLRRLRGVDLVGVCTRTGREARHAADRFGFGYCASDPEELLADPAINSIAILTRNGLHAELACRALAAGKHVLVEKPPALDRADLARLAAAAQAPRASDQPAPDLLVGYNRRHSPLARELRRFFSSTAEPLLIHYRVNARHLPREHWIHDPAEGGGRIVAEIGHFVDLVQFLTGAATIAVTASGTPDAGRYSGDNLVVSVELENGSVASLAYAAGGDAAFGKERIEVFGGGRVGVLDDFRSLRLSHGGKRRRISSRRQDKGHRGEWELFVGAVTGDAVLPAPRDWVATSLATFAIRDSLREARRESIDADRFLTENARAAGA